MSTTPKSRTHKAGLAKRLHISRPTLDKYLATPGAPRPDALGVYDLAAVAKFISAEASKVVEHDEIKKLRIRKLIGECVAIEQGNRISSRQAVSVDEVDAFVKKTMYACKFYLYNGIENELPVKLDGMTAVQMRPYLREFADGLCDHLDRANIILAP